MKTKQILLEPYLTIFHSWKVLSRSMQSRTPSFLSIIKTELEELYQRELSYYFNSTIQDSFTTPSKLKKYKPKHHLLWEYIFCFRESLERITDFIFDTSGKIKNLQLYKQATLYVLKEVLFLSYMKKNNLPMKRIRRKFFIKTPYYIDNLRETHLHAGLALDIYDVIEIAVRNFNQFKKEIKNIKIKDREKPKEVLQRFKLIINLYSILTPECFETENQTDPNKEFDALISYVLKIDKGLPIKQRREYLKKFSLEELLKIAISNLYELNPSSLPSEDEIYKYFASALFIVNLNEILKLNTDKSLYLGLEYFSSEFIKGNPIKSAISNLVKKKEFAEVYRKFFNREETVKGFEIRMFPSKKSLQFWHNFLKELSSEEQRKELQSFKSKINANTKVAPEKEIRINSEIIKEALDKKDYRLIAEILNKALNLKGESKEIDAGINKEFSIIFHFSKLKQPSDFERIKRAYKDIYKTAKRFANFLRDNKEYTFFFSGIDAASMEYWTPPWVFAPLYSFWRNSAIYYIHGLSEKRNPTKFTYHAGEDFVDLGTGLKNIYEAIKFLNLNSGDRIGHALALGVDVRNYSLKHRKIRMSPLYYFFHLLWLNYMTYKHEELVGYRKKVLREISRLESKYRFVRRFFHSLTEIEEKEENREVNIRIVDDMQVLLVNLYDSLKFDFVNFGEDSLFSRLWNSEIRKYCREKYNAFPCKVINIIPKLFSEFVKEKRTGIEFIVLDPLLDENADPDFEEQIEFLERIRDIVLNLVIKKGIVIEACPTSNMIIRGLVDYKDHLVYQLKDKIIKTGLRVTINSDDPLVFNNTLTEEYLLIHEALPEEYKEPVIRALIENSHNFAFKP